MDVTVKILLMHLPASIVIIEESDGFKAILSDVDKSNSLSSIYNNDLEDLINYIKEGLSIYKIGVTSNKTILPLKLVAYSRFNNAMDIVCLWNNICKQKLLKTS